MISQIRGTVAYLEGNVLEVFTPGGVAYQILASGPLVEGLPAEGEDVTVYTHQVIRENDVSLYGFSSREERTAFLLLLGVQGVGPRTALSAVSVLPIRMLSHAIRERDLATIQRVPGIGKKGAERICLDLASKVDLLPGSANPSSGEAQKAVLGLVALGFDEAKARKAVDAVAAEDASLDSSVLIRRAISKAV